MFWDLEEKIIKVFNCGKDNGKNTILNVNLKLLF